MRKQITTLLLLLASSQLALTQGREFLRGKIEEWGSCKTVAITLEGGDVALYGKNGWAGLGIPSTLSDVLDQLNKADQLVHDVQLTDGGKWLVLYGENGMKWSNIPVELETRLREINDQMEVVQSASFNDAGDWIVVTDQRLAASSEPVYDWIRQGEQSFGPVQSAHLTNEGMIVVYKAGFKYYGNVPQPLKKALNETDLKVFRVKFLSNGAYFFCDRYGNYAFYF